MLLEVVPQVDPNCLVLKTTLQQALSKLNQHPCVVCEEVLDLMEGHVVSVRRGSESATDKIARAIARDNRLQLREVLGVELVVFYEVCGRLGVRVRRQHADSFFFQEGLIVNQQLGRWNSLRINQVQNQLQDVEFLEEAEFGYDYGSLSKFSVCYVVLRQLQEIIVVNGVVHMHRLYKVENDLSSQATELVLCEGDHLLGQYERSLVDHVSQSVDHDPDHELGHFLFDAAGFDQL